MLIDWFTTSAQVVNFLILLGLLKIFLFDRITGAMEERKEKINRRLNAAAEKETEAQTRKERFKEKTKQLEAEHDQHLASAEQAANKRRDELIEAARQESRDLKKKWQASLATEKAAFWDGFQRAAAGQIFDMVRKTLSQIADTDVQDRAVDLFLSRLDKDAGDHLPSFIENPPRVKTGVSLSRDQKKAIQNALSKHQKEPVPDIEFVEDPELILGIELSIGAQGGAQGGGKKISWHARDYIHTLEDKLNRIIEGKVNELQEK